MIGIECCNVASTRSDPQKRPYEMYNCLLFVDEDPDCGQLVNSRNTRIIIKETNQEYFNLDLRE